MDDRIDYQQAFRKKVFSLLKMGYDRLDAVSLKNSKEEDITGEIVKKINEVLNERGSPTWMNTFTIHEELPVNKYGRRGKKRKKIDIEFEWTTHRPRYRYPFEAKRLRVRTHSVGVYTGSEGLGEFLSGNYASDRDEAGMIGYVQSNTTDTWAAKVLQQFDTAPEKIQATPDGQWVNHTIVPELEGCFRSKHFRVDSMAPITLYHVFFAFC